MKIHSRLALALPVAAIVFGIGFATHASAAEKDSMSNDTTKKQQTMSKDGMMDKDGTKKDGMMDKDGMKKDTMSKDNMKK